MNMLTVFVILKLEVIKAVLVWVAVLYAGYLIGGFARCWWHSHVDVDVWRLYWLPLRRKVLVVVGIIIAASLIPSSREATIMYLVPAIARSGIWDRAFGTGPSPSAVQEVRQWVRDTVDREPEDGR